MGIVSEWLLVIYTGGMVIYKLWFFQMLPGYVKYLDTILGRFFSESLMLFSVEILFAVDYSMLCEICSKRS